ncbi:MAG: CBS domain-containing protein [Aquihabitans sp.]
MTTEVLTFAPDDPVSEAMQVMVDREIDGAPVVDAGGTVVGMLSTGDLIVQETRLHFPTVVSLLGATLEMPGSKRQFEKDLRQSLGSTVGEVMQADPIIVGADDTVEEAATLLHRHDISRLPVIGDSGLVGIIARVDVLRTILRDDSSES